MWMGGAGYGLACHQYLECHEAQKDNWIGYKLRLMFEVCRISKRIEEYVKQKYFLCFGQNFDIICSKKKLIACVF
jgi:hypothetical protein